MARTFLVTYYRPWEDPIVERVASPAAAVALMDPGLGTFYDDETGEHIIPEEEIAALRVGDEFNVHAGSGTFEVKRTR